LESSTRDSHRAFHHEALQDEATQASSLFVPSLSVRKASTSRPCHANTISTPQNSASAIHHSYRRRSSSKRSSSCPIAKPARPTTTDHTIEPTTSTIVNLTADIPVAPHA